MEQDGRILLVTVGNTSLGQIIGGHFDGDPVTGEDANAIAPQLAGEMSEDDTLLVQLDAKQTAGKLLNDSSSDFNAVFFTHFPPVELYPIGQVGAKERGKKTRLVQLFVRVADEIGSESQ